MTARTVVNPIEVETIRVSTDPLTERAPFTPHAHGTIPSRDRESRARPLGNGIAHQESNRGDHEYRNHGAEGQGEPERASQERRQPEMEERGKGENADTCPGHEHPPGAVPASRGKASRRRRRSAGS